MMAAGGPRTWPGFTASQPPKKHKTIYDGSWGAENLARIHGLSTPQKTKPKRRGKEKRGMAEKHLRQAMLREEHDVGMSLVTHIQ